MPKFTLSVTERHVALMSYIGVEADTLEEAVLKVTQGQVTGYRDECNYDGFIGLSSAQIESDPEGEEDDEDVPEEQVEAASKAVLEKLNPPSPATVWVTTRFDGEPAEKRSYEFDSEALADAFAEGIETGQNWGDEYEFHATEAEADAAVAEYNDEEDEHTCGTCGAPCGPDDYAICDGCTGSAE